MLNLTVSVLITTLAAWIYLAPFPYRTDDELSLSVSIILISLTICYSLWVSAKSRIYTLGYLFNVTWMVSIWLAILTLGQIQYILTPLFLLYIFLTLILFNFGYCIYNLVGVKLRSVNTPIPWFLDSSRFLLVFCLSFVVCLIGYLIEIDSIGYIPLFMALEEGFYGNNAEYLSMIHHLSTSLGAISGAALAFFLLSKRYRIIYFFIFIISICASGSLLAKNILFLSIVFCVSILNFYGYLTAKKVISLIIVFACGVVFLMNARLGDSSYISDYSTIDYAGLPQVFYWFNTYFAVNITHLNTYFENGFTNTYGLKTFQSVTSILGLKEWAKDLVGPEIVYFNGLGGDINVTPLHLSYLTDFGYFSPLVFVFLGFITSYVDTLYRARSSYFVALMFGALSYSLGLSVFGDFLHPLMVYIAMFFLYIPFLFVRKQNRSRISFSVLEKHFEHEL